VDIFFLSNNCDILYISLKETILFDILPRFTQNIYEIINNLYIYIILWLILINIYFWYAMKFGSWLCIINMDTSKVLDIIDQNILIYISIY